MAQRILVADDDQNVLKSLQRLFQSLGYDVDTGSNYCDVQELLRTVPYALIVSDNGMPLAQEPRPDPTCGLQLLGYARMTKHNRATPFILNTGDDREETKRVVKKFGGIYRNKLDREPMHELVEKLLGSPKKATL